LLKTKDCKYLSCKYRKDFEISQLNGKIEDEQNICIQLQKKLKELQVSKNEHIATEYFV